MQLSSKIAFPSPRHGIKIGFSLEASFKLDVPGTLKLHYRSRLLAKNKAKRKKSVKHSFWIGKLLLARVSHFGKRLCLTTVSHFGRRLLLTTVSCFEEAEQRSITTVPHFGQTFGHRTFIFDDSCTFWIAVLA